MCNIHANAPGWWTTRGVLNQNPKDNYQIANLGQAKHIAAMAIAELNDKLADCGGAGFALSDLVTGDPASINNFAPLTVGQLKSIAYRFYDRLNEVNYNFPAGHLINGNYPWQRTVTPGNLELANIGQLKHVFSFDLVQAVPPVSCD